MSINPACCRQTDKERDKKMEENNNMLVRNTDTESDIIFVEDGVTEIGDFAFRGCAAKEIILPDSVESIQQCAFASCKKLERIVFGKGLEYCDDDIILGSPVQEIVWTKPIESENDPAFRSLLYSLIREEDAVYYPHPEKKYDVLKRFLRTGKPQRTFLLTCNGRSVRLPRYICSYLHRLMISDTAYYCLTKNGNAYYEYRNLHSCLSDFQNRVSVVKIMMRDAKEYREAGMEEKAVVLESLKGLVFGKVSMQENSENRK